MEIIERFGHCSGLYLTNPRQIGLWNESQREFGSLRSKMRTYLALIRFAKAAE